MSTRQPSGVDRWVRLLGRPMSRNRLWLAAGVGVLSGLWVILCWLVVGLYNYENGVSDGGAMDIALLAALLMVVVSPTLLLPRAARAIALLLAVVAGVATLALLVEGIGGTPGLNSTDMFLYAVPGTACTMLIGAWKAWHLPPAPAPALGRSDP